jgi:hypothetical protein
LFDEAFFSFLMIFFNFVLVSSVSFGWLVSLVG